MPMNKEYADYVSNYIKIDLPNDEWYKKNFFTFITNKDLLERIIIEHKNARKIYKVFEGIQATDELLLAQIKTQVIMYVSIQEAVINYLLFEKYPNDPVVIKLLNKPRCVKVDIKQNDKKKIESLLQHDGRQLQIYEHKIKPVDKTKIRYEDKVIACFNLDLITEPLKNDLIKLYSYRNTVHLEAELKKQLNYDLTMGELAYKRVEGLSIIISHKLSNKKNR